MQRKVLIINPKYQKSIPNMFGVCEAQDVVNEISAACVMLALEVPIRSFGFSIDKVRDGRK